VAIACCVFLSAVAGAVNAADVKALVGAAVVDLGGRSDIANAIVLIEGDRISGIGTATEVTLPQKQKSLAQSAPG